MITFVYQIRTLSRGFQGKVYWFSKLQQHYSSIIVVLFKGIFQQSIASFPLERYTVGQFWHVSTVLIKLSRVSVVQLWLHVQYLSSPLH